jgi:hypothetical protein
MVKTFLENRYAKGKKESDETRLTASKVEVELHRLITSVISHAPVADPKMSTREKQDFEIKTAALQQAQVYFRKALRELQRGARYLR